MAYILMNIISKDPHFGPETFGLIVDLFIIIMISIGVCSRLIREK